MYNSYLEAAGKLGQIFNDVKDNADRDAKDFMDANSKLFNKMKSADKGFSGFSGNLDKLLNHDLWNSMTPAGKRTITARAKNTVMQFPVYISNTLNVSVAHVISKVYERVYASFVQSTLSQHPIIYNDEVNSAAFLKKFHVNINEAVNVLNEFHEDDIDTFDEIMKESVLNMYLEDNGIMIWHAITPTKDTMNESARLTGLPLEGFEHYFTEDSSNKDYGKTVNTKSSNKVLNPIDYAEREIKNDPAYLPVKNPGPMPKTKTNDTKESAKKAEKMWEIDNKRYKESEEKIENRLKELTTEYDKIFRAGGLNNYIDNILKDEISAMESEEDETKKKEMNKEINKRRSEIQSNFKYAPKSGVVKAKDGGYMINIVDSKTVSEMNRQSNSKDGSKRPDVKAPYIMRDSATIKKINSMAPFEMIGEFGVMDRESKTIHNYKVQFVIGVKSVLHVIDPNDVAEEMDDLITSKNKALQKVRYTTGEIKWKEYFLQLNKNKRDAVSAAKGKWVSRLKKLADDDTIMNDFLDRRNIPNATLVLSSPDVNTIKAISGYDISQIGIAKRLAKNLFLISIAIVDSTAGTMKVLFPDFDNQWDIQSLSNIQVEVNNSENSSLMREFQRISSK